MIIKTESENKIAKEFFKEFTTSSEVTRVLYPKSQNKSVGIVTNNFNILKKFMDKEEKLIYKQHKKGKHKGESYPQKIPKYRLNLNFFFDSRKEFNEIEKKIIEYIFENKDLREVICNSEYLTSGIEDVLKEIFLGKETIFKVSENYLKSFFFRNKKYCSWGKTNIKDAKSIEEEIDIFGHCITHHLQNLINKIRKYSNFKNIHSILYEDIKDFSLIPKLIPQYYSPKQKNKIKNLWAHSFHNNERIIVDLDSKGKIITKFQGNLLDLKIEKIDVSERLRAEDLKEKVDNWVMTNDSELLFGKKQFVDSIKELKLTQEDVLLYRKFYTKQSNS